MIRVCKKVRRDERGTGAIEAAIALPVIISMIYGIFTLGMLFEASAGIHHALGEGARYGNLCLSMSNSVCTLPTKTQLANRVNSKLFGTASADFDAPNVDTTTAPNGYVTISVTYHHTMQFAFFTGPTVTFTRSKRVYLPDSPPTSTACTTAGASAPATCSIYN